MSKRGNAGSERARVQRIVDRSFNAALDLAAMMVEDEVRDQQRTAATLEADYALRALRRLATDLRAKKLPAPEGE